MSDELVEKIADIIDRELRHHTRPIIPRGRDLSCSTNYFAEHIAPKIKQTILSNPNVVEIDPSAELPKVKNFIRNELTAHNTQDDCYKDGQFYMIIKFKEAGWVKPKEK